MKQLKSEIRLIKEQMNMNKIEMEDLKNQVIILKNKSKGKEKVQNDLEIFAPPDNIQDINLLSQISYQKWNVKLKIVINKEFTLHTIALMDSGADLNCI